MSLFARSGSAQKPVNISRRSFLTAAGMTAIALPVLAACGNAGGTASFSAPEVKAPSEFAGRTNVVIWSPWSGNNHEVFTGVVDGFNRSQSDIYAEVQQFNGYDGVTEKIAAGLQARQIPDIGVFSDVSWNKFFLNDTLEPLGGYFDNNFGPSTFNERLFTEGVVRGESYWIPFGRSTPLFYYNKEIFSSAGLPDRAPATWDEFRSWGKHITGQNYNGNSLMMRAYTGADDWYMQGLLWNFGGSISDGLDVTVDSAAAIAAAEFDRAVINDDKIAYLAQEINNDFINGQVATITNSTGSLTGLIKGAQFEVGAGFLPQQTTHGVPTGGAGLGIMKNASPERKEAAAQVLAYLSGEEASSTWTVGTGYLPSTISAANSTKVRRVMSDNPNYKLAVDQLELARQPDAVRRYVQSTITEMRTAIQKLYTENADAGATLKATATKLRADTESVRTLYESKVA